MTTPHLKDTCLCAIVRDEVINPAGGIVDFIDSVVPYVESAVIVDTGSIDGTRELLEEAKIKHSNLIVKDKRFKGFANARNYSLKIGRKNSPNALVLDADERFTLEGLSSLEEISQELYESSDIGMFDFAHVQLNGKYGSSPEWNQRIFPNSKKIKFSGKLYEIPKYPGVGQWISNIASDLRVKNPRIYHFLPSDKAKKEKEQFYKRLKRTPSVAPSRYEHFHQWKEENPHAATIHQPGE